jgi:pimeloyl-ACP methyl ester carboxylesterase
VRIAVRLTLLGVLVLSCAHLRTIAPAHAAASAPTVIFVQGLNSASDSGGALFYHLRTTLETLEPDTVSLDYGYEGGDFDRSGAWQEFPYGACDTHQSVFISAATLRAQVSAVRDRWPDRKVAVVGHSLGGLVAMLEIADAAAGDDPDDQAVPDLVISVHAPLRGTSHPLAAIVRAQVQPADCDEDAALEELAGLRDHNGDAALAQGAALAIQRGAKVLLVANLSDTAFASEVSSQFLDLPGSTIWRFAAIQMDLPNIAPGLIGATGTHHAALFNTAIVRQLATEILADTDY